MAEEIKRRFERGDFLTKKNKKGSFMIYEGNNLSESTTYKRMTLVCNYDPEKYVMGDIGYEQRPHLELGSRNKPCVDTIDTEMEDYWISICTDEQKEEAIRILAEYGLFWNEETFELVDIETGELIRKIVIPDNKYYGQVIKTSSERFKELDKKYCRKKLEPTYYSQYYEEEYYD